MAKTLDGSEDEFVEFEEDDGEIVVIKSVSQLLKEANMKLDRRQEHIDVLNKNLAEMAKEINTLKQELAFFRNDNQTCVSKQPCISKSSSTSSNLVEPLPILLGSASKDEENLQMSFTDSVDDFDILSNDKSCQTDNFHFQKRVKYKATQTRFDKQPSSIFAGGMTDTNLGHDDDDDDDDDQQAGERSSNDRISLSTALGWPNAFKEVGLNMICHLKQTMDPFNMTSTMDSDTMLKDFENIMEERAKAKHVYKSLPTTTVPILTDNSMVSDSNGNQKTLVRCPYCSEEMDRCCMQRHIQSMCGTLELIAFY